MKNLKTVKTRREKSLPQKNIKYFTSLKGEGVCVSICVFVYIPCPTHAFKAEE